MQTGVGRNIRQRYAERFENFIRTADYLSLDYRIIYDNDLNTNLGGGRDMFPPPLEL